MPTPQPQPALPSDETPADGEVLLDAISALEEQTADLTIDDADIFDMIADLGSKGGTKKNRKKKKKVSQPLTPLQQFERGVSPGSAAAGSTAAPSAAPEAVPAIPVAPAVAPTEQPLPSDDCAFPSTIAEARGLLYAQARLVQAGVFSLQVAGMDPGAEAYIYRDVPSLPYLGGEADLTSQIRCMQLVKEVVKGWMFCGNIVKIERNADEAFVILVDYQGHPCKAPLLFLDPATIVPGNSTYCCLNAYHLFTDEVGMPRIGFQQYPSEAELFVVPLHVVTLTEKFNYFAYEDKIRMTYCWGCNSADFGNSPISCDKCDAARYCSTVCKKSDRYNHKKHCTGELSPQSHCWHTLSHHNGCRDWSISQIGGASAQHLSKHELLGYNHQLWGVNCLPGPMCSILHVSLLAMLA